MYGNGQTFCLPRRFCTFLLKISISIVKESDFKIENLTLFIHFSFISEISLFFVDSNKERRRLYEDINCRR